MDCPFIDTNKPRCSENLNMGHLNDAFALCTGKYFLCPLYLEFSRSPAQAAGSIAAGDTTIASQRRPQPAKLPA